MTQATSTRVAGGWRTLAVMPRLGRGARLPLLRYVRERAAMSQKELALKAGVSTAVVSRLEAEPEKHADFETIRKLAAALEVEPRTLMGD